MSKTRKDISEPVWKDYNERTGEELLHYHPMRMKEGQIYPIEWKGKKIGLRKNGISVDFMEFKPD